MWKKIFWWLYNSRKMIIPPIRHRKLVQPLHVCVAHPYYIKRANFHTAIQSLVIHVCSIFTLQIGNAIVFFSNSLNAAMHTSDFVIVDNQVILYATTNGDTFVFITIESAYILFFTTVRTHISLEIVPVRAFFEFVSHNYFSFILFFHILHKNFPANTHSERHTLLL